MLVQPKILEWDDGMGQFTVDPRFDVSSRFPLNAAPQQTQGNYVNAGVTPSGPEMTKGGKQLGFLQTWGTYHQEMTILCKSNGKGWYALGFWGVLFLLDKRSDQTGATSPKLVETSVWSPGKRTTSWVKDWNSMSHRSLDGGFTLHQQPRPGLWPLEASTRFGQAKGSISRISKATKKSKKGQWLQRKVSSTLSHTHMGMGQYLLIPFLGEWTSIYQLFWCSPGVQGFDTLPYCPHFSVASCTAGQLPVRHADLQVEIKITAHHKGHFEFSICRLGLWIKVLQGGSCVFVQYLFGCRLHSSRMFWYVPPNLFSRCFSGANLHFLTFFRLGMPYSID